MNETCDDPQPHYHDAPSSVDWRTAVEQASRAAGQRSTVPRRAIVDWIAATTTPWSPEALVSDMEAQRGISSRATVYRVLDWLRAAGWIARVHSDGMQPAYTRQRPGHHHTAVCTRCGTTIALGGCDVEQQFQSALQSTDFKIHGHVLELYGVCGICRDRGNESDPRRQIARIVCLLGPERAHAFAAQALQTEANGGMLLPDGSRKRTVGGIFFYLVRGGVTPKERWRIWPQRTSPQPSTGGRSAPVVPDLPAFRWEDAGDIIEIGMQHSEEARTVKITLIGRPGQVTERQDVIIGPNGATVL